MTYCNKHPENVAKHQCRVCKNNCCDECIGCAGICKTCWYKIVIVLLVIMVIATYSSWILLL